MRKILILSILIMFLFSITPAFADIWWTGTPDFVVNETADWDSVKVNTTTITDRYNQTANNIQADFPYASKHNNLTHFFRFDKASTTFVNETGGTASCTACPDYTALGKFDSGYDFEATNLDFISLGARPKPNNYTISIWIKPEGWLNSGLVHSIISAGDGNTMWGLLAYDTGDLLTLVVSTGSASQLCQIDVWDSTDTPNSVFTNYIGTANGTDLTIYKNGVVIQNCARTVWSAGTGYGISIGEIGDYDGASNYHYDGIMDEVKMYNESLTQYEVQELYNNGKRYIDTAWAGSNSIWTSDTQTVTAGNK
ncbi:MAG: LamG domain-containing protein, partial [Nanoarchaeota archaeon]|nr:LamG domain-containing protein [Nanoarchaeota archaeon]